MCVYLYITFQMETNLSQENGVASPEQKEDEEKMEVTVTTQLENLIVTPENVDAESNARPEETGGEETHQTAAAAAASSLDIVFKTEDSDDDSDRYLLTDTEKRRER